MLDQTSLTIVTLGVLLLATLAIIAGLVLTARTFATTTELIHALSALALRQTRPGGEWRAVDPEEDKPPDPPEPPKQASPPIG